MKQHSPLLDENGNAMLEFAIVLSLFIVLLAAVFDFSLAVQEQAVMTDAARAAARAAVNRTSEGSCSIFGGCSVSARVAASAAASSAALEYLERSGYPRATYEVVVTYRMEGTTSLVSVNIRRRTGRALIFVPGRVIQSNQASVFRVKGNFCGAGAQTCEDRP